MLAWVCNYRLVLEKLEGACLRCKVPTTTAETVTFHLAGALSGVKRLSMWLTNGTVSCWVGANMGGNVG